MIAAGEFIVRYQKHILIGLGVIALIFLFRLVQARSYLSRTPYGLEREVALGRQNSALAILSLLVIVSLIVYLMQSLILPQIVGPPVTATPTLAPTVTPSPVASGTGIVVDSSGCDNPAATLTAPQSGDRIAGSFEVRGTADIPNLAFYKFEISGAGTSGEWLSLGVGTSPVVNDVLGRFDSGARESGEYAFRLVVLDNAGNGPPPCVVVVTLLSTAP
ncbi:MAG: hypothetical protein IT317_15465 [Anaerolineales bacterium]|nr:hypothetical protein [Anaerolineales bacterium]